MRCLIIETSTRTGLVAIAAGDLVLGERRLEETRHHARDLAPAVNVLLREQGWRPDDIGAVLVSKGPGSYTGLRVGMISAKIFAYATGCALIAIDTFAALAAQAPAEANVVDVVADAQQDRVYLQRFSRYKPLGAMQELTQLVICPFKDWCADTARAPWVTGPGLKAKEGRVPPSTQVSPEATWNVRAETILRLGLPRLDAGERDDPWAVDPIYLRPSAAEQQWEARAKSQQQL